MICSCPSHCDEHCVTCPLHLKRNAKRLWDEYFGPTIPFPGYREAMEILVKTHAEEMYGEPQDSEGVEEDEGKEEEREEENNNLWG